MTEPTDAELLALIEKHLGFKPRRDDTVIDPRTGRFHDVQRYRDMKADILAKWGTPPAVEEPFGWLYEWTHSSATGRADETYTGFTKDEQHARKHDNCRAVYTTPQPTKAQAGAVPLTDEQIDSLLWKYGYDPDDEHMAAMLKEAHGIKGGQHVVKVD